MTLEIIRLETPWNLRTKNVTIADDFLLQNFRDSLKLKGLQACESSSNAKIKLDSSSHGIGLELVKLYRFSRSLKNMSELQDRLVSRADSFPVVIELTYALSVLLNLARLTSIRELPVFA
jgi:hypothetical protein